MVAGAQNDQKHNIITSPPLHMLAARQQANITSSDRMCYIMPTCSRCWPHYNPLPHFPASPLTTPVCNSRDRSNCTAISLHRAYVWLAIVSPPHSMWHVSLQMRHPLALAHYANHPAAGTTPNVMVAAFDLVLESGKSCNLLCSHSKLTGTRLCRMPFAAAQNMSDLYAHSNCIAEAFFAHLASAYTMLLLRWQHGQRCQRICQGAHIMHVMPMRKLSSSVQHSLP